MLRRFYSQVLRRVRRPRAKGSSERCRTGIETLFTVFVGFGLAGAVIILLGARLRPAVATVAKTQAENMVTYFVEETVLSDLNQRSLGYNDFITIQRDSAGTITALTTNMSEMNRLRGSIMACVLERLGEVDVSSVRIPLGNLFGIDFLWGKGPSLHLRAMTVGSVSAEFESEFTSAGVNQTLHRIWLEVRVPLSLILPGEQVDTQACTRVCVAETVIVGQVPEAYFQMG